jgi:hypothetical protein
MAKADDTTSTGWIWLREALALAVTALGSKARAKDQIREWLTAGKLRWKCMSWKALDAEGIAKLRKEGLGAVALSPSGPYYEGDRQFWGFNLLDIDWEDNAARESVGDGAQAWGIRVLRADLRALLPDESRQGEEVHGAGVWIAAEGKRMKDANEIPPDIGISGLARELESRMRKAATTNESLRPIKWPSIKNGLRGWGLWPIDSIK